MSVSGFEVRIRPAKYYKTYTLIGSRVAGVCESVTHFGTILSSHIVKGRTHYEIVCDDMFQGKVDSMELSRRQELYDKEGENDVVGQQKQKVGEKPKS